jgi:hypothetical protein
MDKRVTHGRTRGIVISLGLLAIIGAAPRSPQTVQTRTAGETTRIDLAAVLKSGRLRAVNRQVRALAERPGAVRVNSDAPPGLVWVTGSDFGEGTIEIDVRGRDLYQQSFLGVAFHGTSDESYEEVYLRPFNFRATDPARHQHAVQYAAIPDFDWPRLRQEFPEEFENPVNQSIEPDGWVPLRVVVGRTVVIYVGPDPKPALEVRRLATGNRGMIGLWVGTGSNGDFANLRLTPAK